MPDLIGVLIANFSSFWISHGMESVAVSVLKVEPFLVSCLSLMLTQNDYS